MLGSRAAIPSIIDRRAKDPEKSKGEALQTADDAKRDETKKQKDVGKKKPTNKEVVHKVDSRRSPTIVKSRAEKQILDGNGRQPHQLAANESTPDPSSKEKSRKDKTRKDKTANDKSRKDKALKEKNRKDKLKASAGNANQEDAKPEKADKKRMAQGKGRQRQVDARQGGQPQKAARVVPTALDDVDAKSSRGEYSTRVHTSRLPITGPSNSGMGGTAAYPVVPRFDRWELFDMSHITSGYSGSTSGNTGRCHARECQRHAVAFCSDWRALGSTVISAPYLVPASALGRDGRPPASERVALAVIGTGNQGTNDLRSFLRDERVQIVAVCDINRRGPGYWNGGVAGREPARRIIEDHYAAQKASGKYRGCDAYTDFREVFARRIWMRLKLPRRRWHAIPVIEAARAGLDIYGQKPLSLTIAEGRAMSNAVQQHGVVFQTGSQQQERRELSPGLRTGAERPNWRSENGACGHAQWLARLRQDRRPQGHRSRARGLRF